MKITTTISLCNKEYVTDQDASIRLKSYINEISNRIGDNDMRDEVIRDIEYRITEIFSEKGISENRVITIFHVKEVIRIIGSPDIFGDDKNMYNHQTTQTPSKKLMRDYKDVSLAGVCSGVALYFGVSTPIIRIITILLAIFGGAAAITYVIAWIVIPLARSKEEMHMMDELRENRSR